METMGNEANLQNRTIVCNNVPMKLLKRSVATAHFGRFGHVVSLVLKRKRSACVVQYDDPDAAERALVQAGEYENETFPVAYEKPKKRRSASSSANAKPETDPDWTKDPDVQAELAAMVGNEFAPKRKYNLRPELMALDEMLPTVKKERKSKRTSWKPEVKSAPPPNSDELELLQVLRQAAVTVEDKYKLLEARDKLLRFRRGKQQIDLARTDRTIGTCPDMCPEKERLMREVQHQVAVYEQETGGDRTMNHAIAIKQYSRSSADQESPLPHDLRNVDVLKMTMGYLMHRIMNLCDNPDVNLGEWFHFLWDRTRGIRKDITQQELCCARSVELVEQCARFHIHCSARLVAEDASVFDQKINTENLTKCLQTLKYMYHDLELKGERCPREAEFRAYVILLNLGDGNFMWEVQQLHLEIQKSPEIKFALDVYSALDKNNYVKFFKLVKRTTYMNACILLRYFIQVRVRALTTIVKSYSPRFPHTMFPLGELNRILAFEGANSTIDFLEYYGLAINTERNHVLLDKRNFVMPDLPYALDRAVNVIESKKLVSLGETICAAPLPPPVFERHIPKSSFDENGYLLEFKEEIKEEKRFEKSKDENVFIAQPKVGGFSFDLNFILVKQKKDEEEMRLKMEEQNRIEEKMRLEMLEERRLQEIKSQEIKMQEIKMQELKMREIKMREIKMQEMKIQEMKMQQIKKQEEEAVRRKFLELEEERRLEVLLAEKRKQLEMLQQEELRKIAEAKLKQEEMKRKRMEEAAETMRRENLIKTEVAAVMETMLDAIDAMHARNRLLELKRNVIDRKVIAQWRTKVAANRRKRKAIDDAPLLWIGAKTTSEIAAELRSDACDSNLSLMKRYKSGLPIEIDLHLKQPIETIDLIKLTGEILIKKFHLQNDIYWKVNIVGTFDELDEFLAWKNGILLQQFKLGFRKITYCLQSGLDEDANGMIALGGDCVKVAIPTVTLSNGFNLIERFEWGLKYLAKNVLEWPTLELNTLKTYLMQNLVFELWKRIASFAKWNFAYKKCLTKPNLVIALYNDAIDRLKQLISTEQCRDFPAVFNDFLPSKIPDFLPCDYRYFPSFWKENAYKKMVCDRIESLKLKSYDFKWPPLDQTEIEANVFEYCKIFKNNEHVFFKIMGCILRNFSEDNTSWIGIIEILAKEKVEELNYTLDGFYGASTIFNQLFAVYDSEKLKEYATNAWFYLTNPIVAKEIDVEGGVDGELSHEEDEDSIEIDLDKIEEMVSADNEDDKKCRSELQQFQELMKDLEQSMEIQQVINEKFQDVLKNVLDDC